MICKFGGRLLTTGKRNVPAATTVAPVYVFAALNVSTPEPIFTSEPGPLKTPLNVVLELLLPTQSVTGWPDRFVSTSPWVPVKPPKKKFPPEENPTPPL